MPLVPFIRILMFNHSRSDWQVSLQYRWWRSRASRGSFCRYSKQCRPWMCGHRERRTHRLLHTEAGRLSLIKSTRKIPSYMLKPDRQLIRATPKRFILWKQGNASNQTLTNIKVNLRLNAWKTRLTRAFVRYLRPVMQFWRLKFYWQGQQGSNPRPTVLETLEGWMIPIS